MVPKILKRAIRFGAPLLRSVGARLRPHYRSGAHFPSPPSNSYLTCPLQSLFSAPLMNRIGPSKIAKRDTRVAPSGAIVVADVIKTAALNPLVGLNLWPPQEQRARK